MSNDSAKIGTATDARHHIMATLEALAAGNYAEGEERQMAQDALDRLRLQQQQDVGGMPVLLDDLRRFLVDVAVAKGTDWGERSHRLLERLAGLDEIPGPQHAEMTRELHRLAQLFDLEDGGPQENVDGAHRAYLEERQEHRATLENMQHERDSLESRLEEVEHQRDSLEHQRDRALPGYSDDEGPTRLEQAMDYVDRCVACDTDDARAQAAATLVLAAMSDRKLRREMYGDPCPACNGNGEIKHKEGPTSVVEVTECGLCDGSGRT